MGLIPLESFDFPDEGTGTAQIDVLKFNDRDLIAATKCYIDEVVIYEVAN